MILHDLKLLLTVGLIFITSCSSASFQGNGNSKSPDALRRGGTPGGSGPQSNPNGFPTDKTGDNPGDGPGSNGGNGGPGSGGDPISGINSSCLAKKGSDYNIVVVIDTSLSLRSTDPNNLRSAAVNKFTQNLEGFAKAGKGRSVKVAIVGFARNAKLGNNSPVNLGQDGAAKVIQDVVTLTRTSGIGTNYEAGLNEARQALVDMDAKKGKANQRNFLIFLSDGEPNRGNDGARPANQLIGPINSQVESLAKDLDVAVISIASGSDIKQQGIDIIKNMAENSTKTSFSDHKGQFIRVDSDDDLEGLSKELGKAVSGC